jgi:hypothetical protein
LAKLLIFLFAIAAGVVFYSVRCRRPFWYGIAECFVGVAVIYFVLYPVETNYLLLVNGEPGLKELWPSKTIGVFAGVYVLVRGLDNMSRALPLSWIPMWKQLFPFEGGPMREVNMSASDVLAHMRDGAKLHRGFGDRIELKGRCWNFRGPCRNVRCLDRRT